MANTYTPKTGESRRKLSLTPEERKQDLTERREAKRAQDKETNERLTALRARRKNGSGGSGGGINVVVDTDKK